MSIKRGDVVSHAIAAQWGVGKVTEASAKKVSIIFNDGITRMIACSHFEFLVPAAHSSFVPVSTDAPNVVPSPRGIKAASRSKKKVTP